MLKSDGLDEMLNTPQAISLRKRLEAKTSEVKASEQQIGGDHYKKYPIQPVTFSMANELNHCQANVVKYIVRYKDKDGLKDLEKAIHYIRLLAEFEGYDRPE